MAINYAEKHAAMIDEKFKAASVLTGITNNDYDFVGAKTVHVHSVPTVAMNNYSRTGSDRYGTPAELQDQDQELTLTKDRSFTFTVDKGNSEDDAALNAGKALSRQIDEVIVPEKDKYVLSVMAANAGKAFYGSISASNAYSMLLDVNSYLDDQNVPRAGRVCIVSSAYYKYLKLDASFIKASDVGQQLLIKGQIGEADGVPIVRDAARLPKGVAFMVAHSSATCEAQKLSEYKTHIDPPGINGTLVEGRVYFDAFVLDKKACGIGIARNEKLTLTATNAAGASGKTKFTAVAGHTGELGYAMGTLCYKTAASAIADIDLGADISDTTGYPELAIDTDITVASGAHIRVYLKDEAGRLIGESADAAAARGA